MTIDEKCSTSRRILGHQMMAMLVLLLLLSSLPFASSDNNAAFIAQPLHTNRFIGETTGYVNQRLPMSLSTSTANTTNKSDDATNIPSKPKQSRRNENAQKVFALLNSRYNYNYNNNSNNEDAKSSIHIDLNSSEWTKAKRYIYHATSSSSTKHPLSVDQIISVLDFLDENFQCQGGKDGVIGTGSGTGTGTGIDSILILQTVPRILRKDPKSYLKPTVEFLKGLYGPMFLEFVKRRPDVLLTSGVGYNGNIHDGDDAMNTDHDGNDTTTTTTLTTSVDDENVEAYLTTDLGISANQVAKLKKSHPAIFQLSQAKIYPTVQYLLSACQGPSDEESKSTSTSTSRTIVGKMIKANPNILNLQLANIRAKVDFLQEYGFDSSESLGMLWKKYPGILGLSLESNLRPTTDLLLDLLETRMGASSKSQLSKTLSLHPQLLALAPENLASKAAYFDTIDDACAKSDDDSGTGIASKRKCKSLAARIVMSAPSVYSLSLENNIMPKMEYLSNLWNANNSTSSSSSMSSINPSRHISDYPNILTLSLQGNIQPTISFYNRTGYITVDSNGTCYSNDDSNASDRTYLPARYIATSLYNRLLPRWNFHGVQEANRLNQEEIIHVIDDPNESSILPKSSILPTSSSRPPLHIIAGATDEDFCKRMNYDYETYMKFKEFAMPQLKFSSQFDTWLKTGRPIDIDDAYT